MKQIAKFKCENNISSVQQVFFFTENNIFQMQLITDSIDSAKKLNAKLIAILRISDAEGDSEENKLSFVTETQEKIVIITGNICNAILVLTSHHLLDSKTLKSFQDQDEVELLDCITQTKNIQIKDFYNQSIEKRKGQKTLELPLMDTVFDKAKNFEESLSL